ncbi:DUF4198 domain-containing protein [Fuchsiella alkaliacetigena]|uniref:DUF4198 domain-containing protein n=1 Tax=Fuchsiella alkaliacetigena TaxID=957042 RepID=UPI00200B7EE6|nr:DUF4198 domain-containing protein [Fuchsiella alkaliacetigena]MCK8823634.1 DUF4198 domain-containing protein [Fuchsiella alkaliacetigena]
MASKSKKLLMMLVVTMLVLGFSSQLLAHEMVLDFPQQVESGEEVEIEFFFGHHPDAPDYEHSFFATLEEKAELMVVDEAGNVTELDFELEAAANRYVATFTPEEEGVYWVVAEGPRGVVDRSDRDPSGGMQLRYYDAKAPLIVGGDNEIEIPETPLGAEFISEGSISITEGSEASLRLSYQGEAVSEEEVTVVAPNDQVTELTTDAEGRLEVELDQVGRWFIHIGSLMDLDSSGEDFAEEELTEIIEYDRARYNTTLYLEVEEKPGFFQRLFR